MNCSWVARHLSAYLDNELSAEQQQQVQAHCATCPACAQKLQNLTAVSLLFQAAPAQPAPTGFAAGVMARIQTQPPLPWFRQPFMVGCAEAFAGAVLVAIGLLSGSMLTSLAAPAQRQPLTIAGMPSETFDPLPVASLAHSYLQLTEVRP